MVKYKKWIDKNIKNDFIKKFIFISGGNSGIGFEATRNFVYLGASIIWGCRNLVKANASKDKILAEFANAKIDIIELDLADSKSIDKCAENLVKNYEKIDVFYNNAGVFRIPRGKTKQNYELVIGTNLLGTYYLNSLLFEKFSKSQFIFTTSITAFFNKFDLDDPFFEKRKYGNFKAYGSSKFGINQMTTFLIEKYNKTDQSFALIHPGITYTPLIKKAYKSNLFAALAQCFMKILFHSAEKASLTAIMAVNENSKFSYYGPRGPFSISGFPKRKKLSKKYYNGNNLLFSFLEKLKF